MAGQNRPGISNQAAKIPDVPDAPVVSAADVGTGRAYNNGAATLSITSPTGGYPTSYAATSTPGSFTGSGTSPIIISGLQSATSYTFGVTGTTSTGVTSASGTSNSITATTVPQAPTIGTATDLATSPPSASVTFTGGATGGKTITGYTVTSSPDGLTGTGSSSPITVSGLTNQTNYTFTVTAANANGTSAASSASNSITATLAPAFESIATVTAAGGESTLAFTSIPGTYASLQIRGIGRSTAIDASSSAVNLQVNSVTSGYTYHYLLGSGSYTAASGATSQSSMFSGLLVNAGAGTSNMFGAMIIDLHDYASTSRNKTIRAFFGADANTVFNGSVYISSNLHTSTSAITSIAILPGSGNWAAGSTFALYGIRQA